MKKLMIGAVCAMMAAATFAEPSVEITEAYQQTPGSGIVDYTYTVSGLETGRQYDLCIKVGAKGCTTKKTVTIEEKVSAGTGTKSVDVKALLGSAYPNVTLFAELKVLSGVQLWANGPYFAECNVGANKPEEPGYYFWWGDTVGYKRNSSNNGWVSVKDGKAFTFTTANCSTYNLTVAQLYSKGYIDANSTSAKLTPKYDAATAHLGGSWRMPTHSELTSLVSNCSWASTTQNGIPGLLFTGKNAYSSNSIFLPLSGIGESSNLTCLSPTRLGYFWSSRPDYNLVITSGTADANGRDSRYYGFSVRAVR